MTELIFILLKIAEIGAVVFVPWLVGCPILRYMETTDCWGPCPWDGYGRTIITWIIGAAATLCGLTAVYAMWMVLYAWIGYNWEWAQRLTQ
jgi:hypothetical protein